MGNRGGMCKTPFGSHQRLDKLNFSDMLNPNDPPEKAVLLASLTDSVNNYLFFGLGRNGTSAVEFWYSVEYLFHVRASKRETWEHARVMKTTCFNEALGKRTTTYKTLTDRELQMGCLDYQWELLAFPIRLETFLSDLIKKRRAILAENHEQVLDYILQLQARSLSTFKPGQSIPMGFLTNEMDMILTEPTDPDDVAELVHYTKRKRSSALPRRRCNATNQAALSPSELEEIANMPLFFQPIEGGLFGLETTVH